MLTTSQARGGKQNRHADSAARLSPVDRDNLTVLGNGRVPHDLVERVKFTAQAISHDDVRATVSRDTCRRLLEALFKCRLGSQQRQDQELHESVLGLLEFCRGYLTLSQRSRMIGLAEQASFADCVRFLTDQAN